MFVRLNLILEKMIPFLTPASVIVGILISDYIKDYTFLVPWLFAFMTFEGSLNMNVKGLADVVRNPFPIAILLLFLHIVMPLWALSVGHIIFSGDVLTITGLVLAMVIPTAITAFIWSAMKRGNTALTLAMIVIDSLLSPFVVPLSLAVFVGKSVEMDVTGMMTGLFFMIVLPSIAGIAINEWTKGKAEKEWKPKLAPFSKLGISLVVMLNSSQVAPYFKQPDGKLLMIIITAFFISATGYLFAFLIARFLKYDRETVIAFTYTGGMRNISSGAVIAVSYFPPAVILPVVVGMLFQQVLASLYGTFLEKVYQRNLPESKSMSV